MRGLLMHQPPQLSEKELQRRRRLGLDRWDEMWDGVLHIVPSPFKRHQVISARLLIVLTPEAEGRGLEFYHDLNFFRADDDHRIPDLAAYRTEDSSHRGIEGLAELVVEIVSPRDESRAKLPWYIDRGVHEVFLIDRETLAVERWVRSVDGRPERSLHTTSEVLGCTFERVDANLLRVVTPTGAHDIQLPQAGL